MACIRKRRGKWVVDYRDAAGIRRWVTCETRREAEDALARLLPEARQASRPVVDPDLTLVAYAERWLGLVAASIKPRTLTSYEKALRLHLLPTLGTVKVRQLQKGRVKALLAEKLTGGLSRNSVRIIHATLRAMLNAAVDAGVIVGNPADKLGRQLHLVRPAKARQEEIKAFTREQLDLFLTAAATEQATRRYITRRSSSAWPAPARAWARASRFSGRTSTTPPARSAWPGPSRLDAWRRPRAGTPGRWT